VDELDLDTAAGQTVAEVMIKRPKTVAAGASVSDARQVFANPRVQVCPLVADDGRVVGELTRESIPASADDGAPATQFSSGMPDMIAPGDSMADAMRRLEQLDSERLTVVDADGHLAGLLCLNRRNGQFCVDPR
jgi:predicted transcriptional regulator